MTLKTLLACSAALLLGSAAIAASSDYDILIRNGKVLDGAGNPWVKADVAIKDGRIVRIGKLTGSATRVIDATGRYVSPGFIDMMDQSGETLLVSGGAENKLLEGVTSAIAGEGGTPVPADQIKAYFDKLQAQGIAINFGSYYATYQAREKVMGDRAGTPTPAQMAVMAKEVDTAMHAGAFGISTALIYSPITFQSTADLIALAKVASQCNAIYATHMRDEGPKLIPAIEEAIRIGEEGGVKVEIFHLKAGYRAGWGKLMPEAIATVEAARARGVDVAADMYVYNAGGTGIDITVPTWVWKDGEAKAIERLKDPTIRARLKQEVAAGPQPDWTNMVQAAGGWDNVVLGNAQSAQYDKYNGMSFAKIGAALGKDPADAAWDIMIAGLPHRSMALYFMIGEDDIRTALRQPWVSIGSDAGSSVKLGQIDGLGLPHPRAYGNFTRVIAEYVQKQHVLTLENAIRKMTSWPAQRMGLSDRGLVREGMRADVLVFDLDKVKDVATYQQPLLPSTGIEEVIVNGVITIDQGRPTGARAGQVLRHTCPA
ncbi:amidohydrolase family protein [Sphingomonas sp. MMS24-J13]|uniref:N-acyl-D-amino-acid deacylase family protein n=1 Tax=Sphingomonas sp. MMS24-J13 TaxID=3238686 RepID=UPI003851091E